MDTRRLNMLVRSHMMSMDHMGTSDALGPTSDAVHGQEYHY